MEEKNPKTPPLSIQRENEVMGGTDATVFYWPAWHSFNEDGTIHVKASVYDSEGHSTCIHIVPSDDPDYAFWRRIVGQKKYQRVITEAELSEAKNRFALKAMTPPRFQFTLRGIFWATFWAAVCCAAWLVTFRYPLGKGPGGLGMPTTMSLRIISTSYVVGMAAPFIAIGALFRKTIWGLLAGALAGLAGCLFMEQVATVYWYFRHLFR